MVAGDTPTRREKEGRRALAISIGHRERISPTRNDALEYSSGHSLESLGEKRGKQGKNREGSPLHRLNRMHPLVGQPVVGGKLQKKVG